jgi:hypothetical protein
VPFERLLLVDILGIPGRFGAMLRLTEVRRNEHLIGIDRLKADLRDAVSRHPELLIFPIQSANRPRGIGV